MEYTKIVKVDHAALGLDEARAGQITKAFLPTIDKMLEFIPEFDRLDGMEMTEEKCKAAKELRLKFVKARTETASIHKSEKADYLKAGKYCDAWKNAQGEVSEPYENQLKEWENHFELIEQAKIKELQDSREKALQDLDFPDIPLFLGKMEESVWDILLLGAKTAAEAKLDAERKLEAERVLAEEKRITAEREAKENAELVIKENERLKKEADEAEVKRREERERTDAAVKAELERAAKAEAELKARVESDKAELKAKQEAEAELQRQKEAAAQAELQKGDAQKMVDLIQDLKKIKVKYSFESDEFKSSYRRVGDYLNKLIEKLPVKESK